MNGVPSKRTQQLKELNDAINSEVDRGKKELETDEMKDTINGLYVRIEIVDGALDCQNQCSRRNGLHMLMHSIDKEN